MSLHRWDGTATATSSIAHGGEVLGTITYLRREAFITSHGRLNIPVISGNGVRGILRDIGARLTWEALGEPDLPTPVLHALWSGGALVKAKTKPLTGERLALLRQMVPHIGTFGAAGGGRILDSILSVGKMVPICRETAHLLPTHLREDPATDLELHDLLQIERYSRLPGLGHPAAPSDEHDEDPNDTDGLMRYGMETFTAGTRFHTWFTLAHPRPHEYAFFTEVLDTYLQAPRVGGKTAKGHGTLTLTLTPPSSPPAATTWRDWAGHTPQTVMESLRWLD